MFPCTLVSPLHKKLVIICFFNSMYFTYEDYKTLLLCVAFNLTLLFLTAACLHISCSYDQPNRLQHELKKSKVRHKLNQVTMKLINFIISNFYDNVEETQRTVKRKAEVCNKYSSPYRLDKRSVVSKSLCCLYKSFPPKFCFLLPLSLLVHLLPVNLCV